MKWGETETIKLVELYGEDECLWNITSIDYKNKNKRTSAYEAIVAEIGKELFGVAELKQKIKNLRCTYNQERLKIKKSNKSGAGFIDVYVPTLKWFYIMENFMRNIKGTSETEDSLNKRHFQSFHIEEESNDNEVTQSPSNPNQSEPTESSLQQLQDTPSHSKGTETQQIPKQPVKKAKYSNRQNIQQLRETVTELRNIHANLNMDASESEHNDNTAFGAYVGVTLNKLPLKQSIMAQNEIQGILTKYRLQSCSQTASSPHISGSSSLLSTSPSSNQSLPHEHEDTSHTSSFYADRPVSVQSRNSNDTPGASQEDNTTVPQDMLLLSPDIITQAWGYA